MSNLEHWKNIMKEKRKNTSFREYLKTIVWLRSLNLYKNNWLTSVFPPNNKRIKWVISHREFDENRDNLVKYGIDYNFDINFFDNFKELFSNSYFPPTILFWECENANFTDQTVSVKNCYLSFVVIKWCENVLYSFSVKENSRNIFNSTMVWNECENIYFGNGIIKSYNIFYSKNIINWANIWFSNNLIWCSECIFCDNLENQSYHINNKKYDKKDYFEEKNKILKEKHLFSSKYYEINNNWKNYWSNNINWFFNIECENIENWCNNYQIKNWRNVMFIWWKDAWENIYDCFLNTPFENDIYWVFSTWFCDNIYNSYQINWWTNVFYSCLLENCSFCVWCVWLKNKSFCILNKQYSKEEWYELVEKVFSQMERDLILWEFFPGELNPFYFNDSVAYLIDESFKKEELEKDWYLWRDEEIKVDIPDNSEIAEIKDLNNYQWFDSNWNWQINSEIMKKMIKDKKWNIYKVVPMEYEFLIKNWLPLPEIHWLDRIKLWFKF